MSALSLASLVCTAVLRLDTFCFPSIKILVPDFLFFTFPVALCLSRAVGVEGPGAGNGIRTRDPELGRLVL